MYTRNEPTRRRLKELERTIQYLYHDMERYNGMMEAMDGIISMIEHGEKNRYGRSVVDSLKNTKMDGMIAYTKAGGLASPDETAPRKYSTITPHGMMPAKQP